MGCLVKGVSPRPDTRPSRIDRKTVPFREICETAAGIDNMSFAVRATRLAIRWLVKVAGYRIAARALAALAPEAAAAGFARRGRHIPYLIRVNKLRLDYLESLSRSELREAVEKKVLWAEFAAASSPSRASRWDAKGYLALLSRHGWYGGKFEQCRRQPGMASERTFYIYGPNATRSPSSEYPESTLVLTKPIDVDVSAYAGCILFINSMYFAKIAGDPPLREAITDKYGRVFVNCRLARLDPPFVRARFPIGDNIASAMALGRVLYNLERTYGSFRVVIEGFDFYLERSTYAAYYPSMARNDDATISERIICRALADHDALYNFLFVKEMIARHELVDSHAFRSIIELDGGEYLDRLARVRNFASLRSP